MIQLHGKPLVAVKLEERNRKKKDESLNRIRNMPAWRSPTSELSRDFKVLSQKLMPQRDSALGAERSVGSNLSNSQGSYDKGGNRNYYILNVDNDTNDDRAAYKSRSSKADPASGMEQDPAPVYR